MDDLTRLWYYLICEEKGILPTSEAELGLDMNVFLARFPPEEARVMKRKFRKLWRKIYDSPRTWSSYWTKREPWRRKREVRKVLLKTAEKKVEKILSSSVKEEEDGIK
jgi:hypothetical protein